MGPYLKAWGSLIVLVSVKALNKCSEECSEVFHLLVQLLGNANKGQFHLDNETTVKFLRREIEKRLRAVVTVATLESGINQ